MKAEMKDLKLGTCEQKRNEAVLNLLLGWFSYAFVIGCMGVFAGLFAATGDSFSDVITRHPFLSVAGLFGVIGGGVYLARKTRALSKRDSR